MTKKHLMMVLDAMAREWRKSITGDGRVAIENTVYALADEFGAGLPRFDRTKFLAYWEKVRDL